LTRWAVLTAELATMIRPALAASGHRGIMAPAINSYIPARHIPDAQLITYPDSGHGVLVQYPACSRPTSPASPGTDAAFA
jgi:pimeloyl-ACP methyl ester carboxylesterase